MENRIVIGILNIVEDKLREFNIKIPDEYREDSDDPIVGYAYAELHDRIKEYLEEEDLIKTLSFSPGITVSSEQAKEETISTSKPKVYCQNDKGSSDFYNSINYFSNALGELNDISEDELPEALKYAYDNLYFEGDTGSLRYLVEIEKGFGIALINEYKECYAEDCGLTMSELFQSAEKDALEIAKDPAFEKAEIRLGENMGFDNSHNLIVIFPADISKEEFINAAVRLDSHVYKAAKSFHSSFEKKPSLSSLIDSAKERTSDDAKNDISERSR